MHQGIRLAAPPDGHQQSVRNQLRCHAGGHDGQAGKQKTAGQ
jgi:hypothetical protein